MKKWQSRCIGKACVTVISGGLLLGLTGGAFAGQSSCVTCHTDEDMLEDNLAVVKKKKSAMQSGAG